MKTIYLHIGTPKTGSTALQHFLWDNKSILSNHNIEAINPFVEAWNLCCCYFRPKAWLSNPFKEDHSLKKNWLSNFKKDIDASPHNNLIISQENFSHIKANNIIEFRDFFSGYETKVICYLRRQDLRLESAYQEAIKTVPGLSKTFEQWVNNAHFMESRLNYDAFISKWANAFGDSNVIIRPFERTQFTNGSIFDDFLSIMNIDINEMFVLPKPEQSNVAISQDFIEVIRLCNSIPIFSVEEEQKKDFDKRWPREVAFLAPKSSKNTPEKKNSFITPLQRENLMKKYHEGNSNIARKYLNRPDGILFHDSIVDDKTPVDHEFSAKNLTPILTEMIYGLTTRLNNLEEKSNANSSKSLISQSKERFLRKIKHLLHLIS